MKVDANKSPSLNQRKYLSGLKRSFQFLVSKAFSYNNLDKNFKHPINHIMYDFSKEKCLKKSEENAKKENEKHKDCVIYCRLDMALGYFVLEIKV